MSQYPGGPPPPPPQDPNYGQPPTEPYGAPPPQPPSDPYLGGPPQDPYTPPQDPYAPPQDPYSPPQDPYYGQQPPQQDAYAHQQDAYAQQQAWHAQQQAARKATSDADARRPRGGSGAAIFGILLVLVGAWVLFGDQLDVDLDFSELWPVAAVVLGGIMVVASVIPRRGGDEG